MRRVMRAQLILVALLASAPAAAAQKSKPVDASECFTCHDEHKAFHERGKHRKVNCVACHAGLDAHTADPDHKLPETRMDHATCGECHKDQFESFMAMNLASKARVEKASFKSRSPLFDKLMAPHGFTKEHNEPRSHAFMLVDHLIVDRAYGGRFQLKDWRQITNALGSAANAWNVLVDKEPASHEQKSFLPQTAMAANPTCLQCKSQDNILTWKYMGDPDPKAKWDRTSKVVDVARSLRHPVNCFACHDPHSTEPRVVRDALINAVVDRGAGTYPYDKQKSQKTKMTKVTFRDGFRAIGVLSRPDSNVMCAQCHVEYNCNAGVDPRTGAKVGYDDKRTNHFPWVSVLDLEKHYTTLGFKDFKHDVTGALLTKLQHPETETFWMSKHERAGVECKDCHMPKMRSKGKGKEFTWHGQKSARYMTRDTCLRCHKDWSEQEAEYQIDSIQNYVRGKMTKAEFWLGQLIDRHAAARKAGVSEEVLKQARARHDTAHILWEWWTAENSDGFHNPQLARESLARSITASQEGIKLLDQALAPTAQGPAPREPAKPAPRPPAASR